VLAEGDGARPLRTRHVLGERDRSRPRWGSVAATLDLGPQIQNLREAELDRVPRRLWLKRSRHLSQLSRWEGRDGGAGSRRPSGGAVRPSCRSARRPRPPTRGREMHGTNPPRRVSLFRRSCRRRQGGNAAWGEIPRPWRSLLASSGISSSTPLVSTRQRASAVSSQVLETAKPGYGLRPGPCQRPG
jgi:hypothetical protein